VHVVEAVAFVLTLRRQQGTIAVTTGTSDWDNELDLAPLSDCAVSYSDPARAPVVSGRRLMASPMIRLVNVSKVYNGAAGRVAALVGVSLEVAAGEFVALMGPSGCGKSTLLHLVAAVDVPTSGEVWVDGQHLTRLTDAALSRFRRDRVGTVYQFYNLLPTLSSWENVALPAILAGISPREARERALAWLERVAMARRAEHWPHELSGGEMQRVAVARALINRPAVLLADEPTGNLDSVAGRELLQLLAELNAEHRVTILLATHSEDAAATAVRTLYLKDGAFAGPTAAPSPR
jgi:putative ABC transport system ATP-binding protein